VGKTKFHHLWPPWNLLLAFSEKSTIAPLGKNLSDAHGDLGKESW